MLGGALSDKVTWRWCFYINLPIGGLSALIIFFIFKTPKHAAAVAAPFKEKLLQLDLIGSFTIMAAVCCFILALQWGGVTKPWNNSSVVGTLIGFGLIIILFVVIQWWEGERAVFVGRLLRNPILAIGITYAFFFVGSFFNILYYLPIYFQAVDGVSATDSGIRNLAMILAVSIATILSGGIITATGHFAPFMVIAGVIATIGSGFIYTLDIDTPSAKWIGYQVLVGLGLGIISPVQ